jgi:hypothetical protein
MAGEGGLSRGSGVDAVPALRGGIDCFALLAMAFDGITAFFPSIDS